MKNDKRDKKSTKRGRKILEKNGKRTTTKKIFVVFPNKDRGLIATRQKAWQKQKRRGERRKNFDAIGLVMRMKGPH